MGHKMLRFLSKLNLITINFLLLWRSADYDGLQWTDPIFFYRPLSIFPYLQSCQSLFVKYDKWEKVVDIFTDAGKTEKFQTLRGNSIMY